MHIFNEEKMFYHIVLTAECNSRCRYCYEKSVNDIGADFCLEVNEDIPTDIAYSISELREFIEKDKDAYVTFYGGEPLLRIGKIKEIMDSVKAKAFLMQTNGLLLDNLPKEYANRMHTILVSIDGDEKLTDSNRGKGTYDKVLKNIKHLRENSFKGEIIARMTVTENTDISREVMHLLSLGFASIHWQMDANFWQKDYDKRNFKKWAEESYNPGIRKLISFWLDEIKKGNVIKLYPLLGVFNSIINNEEKCLLRCGAGWINYAILPNGEISACPCTGGIKKLNFGSIKNTNPANLKKIHAGGDCLKCSYCNLCGGRCLYSNTLSPWPKEGREEVCNAIKNLISSLKAIKPDVERLIKKRVITLKDFDYLKYNGAEIIP